MRENRCKVPMGKRKVGTIAEAMTVFYRVEDIFESQVDYEEGITIKKINEICLENVNYAFDNSNIIIKNINLNIKEGNHIILYGNNGSGKSTLANLIIGNYSPSNGNILYNECKNVSSKTIKKFITYVEQEDFFFHDTLYNNLTACNCFIENFEKICVLTGVDKIVNNLPNGYNTIITENGSNFSPGQKKLFALARALLRDTPIYIFDEITNGVDILTKNKIYKIFESEFDNKTYILITHDKDFEKVGNIVYKFSQGELVKENGGKDGNTVRNEKPFQGIP
jgi:ABC-type bacteriocin/lantibiotic exporter with double-glycine peptidase domain